MQGGGGLGTGEGRTRTWRRAMVIVDPRKDNKEQCCASCLNIISTLYFLPDMCHYDIRVIHKQITIFLISSYLKKQRNPI